MYIYVQCCVRFTNETSNNAVGGKTVRREYIKVANELCQRMHTVYLLHFWSGSKLHWLWFDEIDELVGWVRRRKRLLRTAQQSVKSTKHDYGTASELILGSYFIQDAYVQLYYTIAYITAFHDTRDEADFDKSTSLCRGRTTTRLNPLITRG